MKILDIIVCFSIAIFAISAAAADSIQGCGGFVEASRSLIKSRKQSDPKLDYSHITVELRTVDGLVKDRTQCAPNGYYFIPVYDKGSFVIKIKGPEGWSWDPDNVPVVIDQNGCNGNADINFRFTGFTLSGRVVGAVGGESCLSKEGGPSNVKVELLSLTDDVISSVFTSSVGGYSFTNIIPGLECSLLHFNSSSSTNSYHLMNDERGDPNYFCTFHFMIVFYGVPFFIGHVKFLTHPNTNPNQVPHNQCYNQGLILGCFCGGEVPHQYQWIGYGILINSQRQYHWVMGIKN